MSKWCTKCKTYKPLESFWKKAKLKDGLQSWCKTCVLGGHKKYTDTYKGKEARRRTGLKYEYGITIEDYNRLLEAQRGRCAICYKMSYTNRGKKYLSVDHCHETGIVRGLLCHKCNTAIGFLDNDPNTADAAFEYLLIAYKRKEAFKVSQTPQYSGN